MKQIFVLCLIILNSAIAFGQYAEFSFEEKILKLAPAFEGPTLLFDFSFVNTGDAPLIISESKVECTCTVVEYPAEPILPGESGIIHVSFDTLGKTGWQYRKVRLYANVKKEVEEIEFRIKILND